MFKNYGSMTKTEAKESYICIWEVTEIIASLEEENADQRAISQKTETCAAPLPYIIDRF